MFAIRNMRFGDVEVVAKMVALDHDANLEKGYVEAKEHTFDHLKIVPQHCYVAENSNRQIVAAMVLHSQNKVFEIKDFHVKDITQNKKALALLKTNSLNI